MRELAVCNSLLEALVQEFEAYNWRLVAWSGTKQRLVADQMDPFACHLHSRTAGRVDCIVVVVLDIEVYF